MKIIKRLFGSEKSVKTSYQKVNRLDCKPNDFTKHAAVKPFEEIKVNLEKRAKALFNIETEVYIKYMNKFETFFASKPYQIIHCGQRRIGVKIYYRRNNMKAWDYFSVAWLWFCPYCGDIIEEHCGSILP